MPAVHPAALCLHSDRHRRFLWCADGEPAWRAGTRKGARAARQIRGRYQYSSCHLLRSNISKRPVIKTRMHRARRVANAANFTWQFSVWRTRNNSDFDNLRHISTVKRSRQHCFANMSTRHRDFCQVALPGCPKCAVPSTEDEAWQESLSQAVGLSS